MRVEWLSLRSEVVGVLFVRRNARCRGRRIHHAAVTSPPAKGRVLSPELSVAIGGCRCSEKSTKQRRIRWFDLCGLAALSGVGKERGFREGSRGDGAEERNLGDPALGGRGKATTSKVSVNEGLLGDSQQAGWARRATRFPSEGVVEGESSVAGLQSARLPPRPVDCFQPITRQVQAGLPPSQPRATQGKGGAETKLRTWTSLSRRLWLFFTLTLASNPITSSPSHSCFSPVLPCEPQHAWSNHRVSSRRTSLPPALQARHLLHFILLASSSSSKQSVSRVITEVACPQGGTGTRSAILLLPAETCFRSSRSNSA